MQCGYPAHRNRHCDQPQAVIGCRMVMPPFDEMNESDVREHILRPLLHDLGWKLGTSANIRTEIKLTYGKAFLGRKDSKRDPDLVGRADYVCDLIGVARWVIEAKSPSQHLVRDDVEQAHTYASHPQVNATYFLLSNGRRFELYQTSYIDSPILAFDYADLEIRRNDLLEVVGPEALRTRHTGPFSPLVRRQSADGIGIASGWGPQAKIMGGWLLYKGIVKASPAFAKTLEVAVGRRAQVIGEYAYRTSGNEIRADLKVVQATVELDRLATLMNLGGYSISTSEEFVSSDRERPTIFGGQLFGQMPANVDLSAIPGSSKGTHLPWPINFVAEMRAVGFLDGTSLHGTFEYDIAYDMDFGPVPQQLHAFLRAQLQQSFHSIWGEFELRLMTVGRSQLPANLDLLELS